MSNAFKNQYVADGTQKQFTFSFKIPLTRKLNVYVQQANAQADETKDLVSRSNYVIRFNGDSGISDGHITFNSAPENQSIVTIIPDSSTKISYVFSNTQLFNADDLNESFDETSSTNNFQLTNYLNASLRYNLNEQESKLNYANVMPPLPDKSWWRREKDKMIAQNFDNFVKEVITILGVKFNSYVNATENNLALSAQVANKPFGQDYSGNIETVDEKGEIVSTPLPPGKSALSGAQSAKMWAEQKGAFIDAYGNKGYSSRHYSLEAQESATSAGSLIAELYIKSEKPTKTIKLIDYAITPNEPWLHVAPNSFSVYIDGEKLPDPKTYSDGQTEPPKLYTVKIVDKPTLANPSTITFAPLIPAGKEIIVAKGVVHGSSASMYSDSRNAIFDEHSRVASRDLANINFSTNTEVAGRGLDNIRFSKLTQVADKSLDNVDFGDIILKKMIDILFPIGSIFLSADDGTNPPAHGRAGIVWGEENIADGHVLVGASGGNDWEVDAGKVAGDRRTCDPMKTSDLIKHTHSVYALNEGTPGGSFSIYTLGSFQHYSFVDQSAIEPTGQANPTGITLKNVARYGVIIWRRIS